MVGIASTRESHLSFSAKHTLLLPKLATVLTVQFDDYTDLGPIAPMFLKSPLS